MGREKKLLENSMKNRQKFKFDDFHQSFRKKSKKGDASERRFILTRPLRIDFCSKAWVVRNILETWNIPVTGLEYFLLAFENWKLGKDFSKTGWVRPSSIFTQNRKKLRIFKRR